MKADVSRAKCYLLVDGAAMTGGTNSYAQHGRGEFRGTLVETEYPAGRVCQGCKAQGLLGWMPTADMLVDGQCQRCRDGREFGV